MKRKSPTRKPSEKKMANGLKPWQRLKALRERTGLTQAQTAAMGGYQTTSGYAKNEQEKSMGSKAIPHECIQRIIPVFRGAGSPPITIEEILALSDLKEMPKTVERAYVSLVDSVGGTTLPVQYRVESGTYIRKGSSRSYGASRLGPSVNYNAASQFVAVLAETVTDVGPPGTQVHCVAAKDVDPSTLRGKRVLVGVDAEGGMIEVTVGKCGPDGNMYKLNTMPLKGDVLGMIIGVYRVE